MKISATTTESSPQQSELGHVYKRKNIVNLEYIDVELGHGLRQGNLCTCHISVNGYNALDTTYLTEEERF